MTVLVYVESMAVYAKDGKYFLTSVIEKAYATADIVMPCSGEVLAEAGEVNPLAVARVINWLNDLPRACREGQSDCSHCPIFE